MNTAANFVTSDGCVFVAICLQGLDHCIHHPTYIHSIAILCCFAYDQTKKSLGSMNKKEARLQI
jgi:hypothetical protein